MSGWQTNQLIELIQKRYPDWVDFEHPQYLADEIRPKKKLVEKAASFLSLEALDECITQGQFETCLTALKQLTRQTNLLWRRVPTSGDTAVLEATNLNPADFVIQIRNLLYGDRPVGERLNTFSEYLTLDDLPNKWPFPTFLLFVTHPESEMFVKPRSARWFFQFMGHVHPFSRIPDGPTYQLVQTLCQALLEQLRPFGAVDMLDVQSAIWIGMRESKNLVGSLDQKSQIFLDIPPTPPMHTPSMAATDAVALHDKEETPYQASAAYTIDMMVEETGLPPEEINRWLKAIERKKQVMFYGPPGTGKTFYAEKLGRLIANQSDSGEGFYETIQFHPSYSYEDFIEGIRPLTQNNQVIFAKKPGQFIRFCQKAEGHSGICTLIIDEINRANLPSVFGELMVLLEYRDKFMPLASGTLFKIPKNVRIIATMNSADRSLALVDFALRRRFAFIHQPPRYQQLKVVHPSSKVNIDNLIQLLETINAKIGDPNYAIGHSYFFTPDIHLHLANIWELEIFPFLQEYFVGSFDQIAPFAWGNVESSLLGEWKQ